MLEVQSFARTYSDVGRRERVRGNFQNSSKIFGRRHPQKFALNSQKNSRNPHNNSLLRPSKKAFLDSIKRTQIPRI